MPVMARRHARFCSTRCRVAAHRARQIPSELRSRSRWVRYSRAKVPLTTDGRVASSTDARTWSSYADAKASSVGVGVGFVLNGDGLICLDLDDCVHGGMLTPAAARLLERLPRTWVEVSPSGRGLHVWGFGDVKAGRRTTVDGVKVEVYGTGRYITVTGKPWSAAPLAHLDLADLL